MVRNSILPSGRSIVHLVLADYPLTVFIQPYSLTMRSKPSLPFHNPLLLMLAAVASDSMAEFVTPSFLSESSIATRQLKQDGSGKTLDFYIFETHRSYVTAFEYNNTVDCDCREDDTTNCMIGGRRFWMENHCYSDYRGTTEGQVFLARQGTTVGGFFCTNQYTNASCSTVKSTCRNGDNVGSCYSKGRNQFSVLKDWCVEASGVLPPDNDFVVPIVKTSVFPSIYECQEGVNAIDYLVPVSDQLCHATSVATKTNERILGGLMFTCQGDTLTQTTYANRQCDEGISRIFYPANECISVGGLHSKSMGCDSAPLFFCKRFDNASFVGSVLETPVPTPVTAAPVTSSPVTLSPVDMPTTLPASDALRANDGRFQFCWCFCLFAILHFWR